MKKDNKIAIFFGTTLVLFVIIAVLLRVYSAQLNANASTQNANEIAAENNYAQPVPSPSISPEYYGDIPASESGPNQVVTFTKTFFVPTSLMPIKLAIAADNSYSVSVNGQFVGASNIEDTNYAAPTSYDLTPVLHEGKENTLLITVTNLWMYGGYAWDYNPGGLLYEVTNNGSILTASDGTESSSYQNATDSAMVIPPFSSWTVLNGAQWIWDQGLYEEYSSSTQQ
jgi:hypothetical protein